MERIVKKDRKGIFIIISNETWRPLRRTNGHIKVGDKVLVNIWWCGVKATVTPGIGKASETWGASLY